MPMKRKDPVARARALEARRELRTTTCYMCACRCGIRVHLRDGEPRYIDGNPNHPLNRGVICAKGGAGLMKQHSPARLTTPLRRRAGADRGAADFEPIGWDEAMRMLTERLARLRATDPRRFALFTGRDQMQALTGLFAKQYGTPNYAAHGGFCSVNMAAGMIYTVGGSFWEFGGPDLERAKLFVMLGTAEDHHSNPLKIALGELKRAGGRFVSINPVRTGYSAIADEWIPIRPGTDGALLLALAHVLVREQRVDEDFVRRYTNGAHLIVCEDGRADSGLPAQAQAPVLVWDAVAGEARGLGADGRVPDTAALRGTYRLGGGTVVRPAYELLVERLSTCTPAWAETITGIPAARIESLARELGRVAFDEAYELPVAWTDAWGGSHDSVTARPVAFHAMRGLAAHSNGFQTVRALAVLMTLLGTIDRPGGFRHKAPYPRDVPPPIRNPRGPQDVKPDTPLEGAPLGFPASPDDLALDDDGGPLRIDKAFSWEHPLAIHGMMHNVITNAWRGDPYPIDTLLIFMANMAWNSTMNTQRVREMLNDKGPDGEYRIPFLVVCDAFQSEMTAYADLVLPDTTYLERHDAMSLLDRPISEFEGPVDSVRVPVVAPKGACRPFQDVLVELAGRLELPAFVDAAGQPRYADYRDFVVRYETAPGSGIGFLAGWRGANGEKSLRGEPNPRQWEMYAAHDCVFQHEMPQAHRWMRNWNRGYLDFARDAGFRPSATPIVIQLYSPVLQQFRLAAQGLREGRQPPEHLRERIARYFDPLPFWYAPLEHGAVDTDAYPLAAVTQRPMAMYHSWDSQNAWLRQLHSHNYLYVNPGTARAAGVEDGGWLWVESAWGRVRCMARHSEAVEPGTVWTWNAIGKSTGAWRLAPDADESRLGFLLNHLITEELPRARGGPASNSDPITGQAGWYDVRVRLRAAGADEAGETWPRAAQAMPALPGTGTVDRVLRFFARGTRP